MMCAEIGETIVIVALFTLVGYMFKVLLTGR